MSSVALDRLVKRYRNTEVVKGVDLHVEEGEFLVLLGPSGCGKTTILRMVAGFVTPTSGTIRIGGEAVDRMPPRARNIGMVFQDYALFPNLTVAENVGFGLVERGARRDEIASRTKEMLKLIHLDHLPDRLPAQLSGGQQQRVALARALAYAPRVLLMDEPLSALDQVLREEMQREFSRIQHQFGTTTIFVTHDQQEAMALADRIVVMNGGIIEQAGRPQDLYDDPRTAFIANFIGRSNSLPGTVERIAGDQVLVRHASGTVLARARGALAAGDRVACMIRPERMRVADRGGAESDNHLAARLVRRTFLGDSLQLVLEAEGRELLVRQSRLEEAPPGPEVTVRFAAADTLCFPAPAPTPAPAPAPAGP